MDFTNIESVQIDFTQFAEGIYFVKINGWDMKKVVLIK